MLASELKRPRKFIKFCLVGAVNAVVDFTVFALLSFWAAPLLVAQGVAYSCGVVNSFLMNRAWTFGQHGRHSGQLARFLTLNFLTFALTYGLLAGFHYYLGWPILVSKLVATGVGFVVNFAGSRLWVFSPASI